MKALEIARKWTPEIETKFNTIINNNPDLPLSLLTFSQPPNRRSHRVNFEVAKEQRASFLINPPEHLKQKKYDMTFQ